MFYGSKSSCAYRAYDLVPPTIDGVSTSSMSLLNICADIVWATGYMDIVLLYVIATMAKFIIKPFFRQHLMNLFRMYIPIHLKLYNNILCIPTLIFEPKQTPCIKPSCLRLLSAVLCRYRPADQRTERKNLVSVSMRAQDLVRAHKEKIKSRSSGLVGRPVYKKHRSVLSL